MNLQGQDSQKTSELSQSSLPSNQKTGNRTSQDKIEFVTDDIGCTTHQINNEYIEQQYLAANYTSYKSPLTGSNFKIFKRPKQFNNLSKYPEQLTFPYNQQIEPLYTSKSDNSESYSYREHPHDNCSKKQLSMDREQNYGSITEKVEYFDDELICEGCQKYLSKLTTLRKQNVHLDFTVKKQTEEIEDLKKTKQQLILIIEKKYQNSPSKTQKTIQSIQTLNFNLHPSENTQIRYDLQAQLYEQKFMNNLLMLQLTQLTTNDESHSAKLQQIIMTAQKYQKLLLQNFKLQAQVMTFQKIATDHQYRPIFHYNIRIQKLRNAVAYWYRVAMRECKELRKQCQAIRNQNRRNREDIFTDFRKQLDCLFFKSKKSLPNKEFHSEYDDSGAKIALTQPIQTQKNKSNSHKMVTFLRSPTHKNTHFQNSEQSRGHSLSSTDKKSRSKKKRSQRNSIEQKKIRMKQEQGSQTQRKRASILRASKAYLQNQASEQKRKKKSRNNSIKINSRIKCEISGSHNEYNQSSETKRERKGLKK